MRKITTTIVAALAILTFAGLTAAPAQASTATWTQKDRQYVYILRHMAPAFYSVPARELVPLAHNICDSLNLGTDESEVLFTIMDAGFSKKQAVALEVSAMQFYCAWHSDDIR